MPNTVKYNIYYPGPSDLVKPTTSQFRSMANTMDAALSVMQDRVEIANADAVEQAQVYATEAKQSSAAAQTTAQAAATQAAAAVTEAQRAASEAAVSSANATKAVDLAATAAAAAYATPDAGTAALVSNTATQTRAKLNEVVANYSAAKGTDLITNGTGYMGNNYNFSTLTYNPADAPVGISGSFVSAVGYRTTTTDEFISVDPAKKYVMSLYARETVTASSRLYAGYSYYDISKLAISPIHYYYRPETTTTLAADLKNGDTTATLTSGAGWTATNGYLLAWNYIDATGKAWPEGTYSRNVRQITAVSGNTVTLASGWSYGTVPAGTRVSNSMSAGSYAYAAASQAAIGSAWTKFTSAIITGVTNGKMEEAKTTFPYGTAFIKGLFLLNYPTGSPAGSRQAIAGVSFSESAALQAQIDSFTAPVISDRTVLVDDYKQAGDLDDGPAFRRAAQAAERVQLGPRQYIISPTTTASGNRLCVPMSHKVSWIGPGRDVCTVKVAANAGDYYAIFGPDTGATVPDDAVMADLSGSSLKGFTLDQNSTENPVTSHANQLKRATSTSPYRGRNGISVFKGIGVSVEDMRFRDFQSIWCIQAMGQGVGRATVRRTEFLDIGSDTVNWDHTTVYLDASLGGVIEGCVFEARKYAARQPFELHGSRMFAFGNLVQGYVYGGDITGSIWHGPGSGSVYGNQFLGVASGLDIWTGTNYGTVGSYGIDGFAFTDNLVTVDHARWAGSWYTGMVTLNGGASLPIRGLDISRNTYRLMNLGTPSSIDQASQVVSLYRNVTPTAVTGGNNFDVGITVANNRVFGSVAGFMRYVCYGGGLDGLSVTNNTVRDIGRAQAAGSTAYNGVGNAALLVEAGTLRNSQHLGNSYTDTTTPRGLQRGAYYVASNLENVFDDGSRIVTADGNPITLASTSSTTGAISMSGQVPKFVPSAHTARFVAGSTVLDESTGILYRQAVTGPSQWVAVS